MQHKSKAGRKLSPELKAVVEPIYQRDRIRYDGICRWVWTQQKRGFSDESIAACLRLADSKIDAVWHWWSYLTKLMPKASGRASEQESDKYKREEKNFIDALLEHCRPREKAWTK